MPYGSIQALPDSVRSVLPVTAQEIYLAAFNAAFSGTCKDRDDREVCANKIAWSAVKRTYEKGDSGTWKKISKRDLACCRTGTCTRIQKSTGSQEHSAILQLLNRQIGNTFFNVEPFEENVNAWNGTPIIFSDFPPLKDGTKSDHIDFEPFTTDILISELERVNGAIIGEVRHPTIETTGHPRLMGDLVFTKETAERLFNEGKLTEEIYKRTDAYLEKATDLLNEGKLSHSTGFSCKSKDGTLSSEIPLVPNHVLVFLEDESNQPKDRGAVILNKSTEVVMTEEKGWLHQIQQKIGAVTEEIFKSRFAPGSDEERSMLLFKAVNERFGEGGTTPQERYGAFVEATFDEYVIVNTPTGVLYSVPYTLTETGANFGSPVEVEVSYVPKAQTTQNQDEVTDMDATMNKELEEAKTQVSTKDAEVLALKQTVDTLTKQVEEFQKAQKDAAWEVEKKKLKAGLIHTEQDEAAMKALFQTDPYSYMQKAEYIGAAPTPESGDKFANKGDLNGKKDEDPFAVASELRKLTGR